MKYVLLSITLVFSFVMQATAAKNEEPIKLESHIVGDKEQPAVSYFVPWQEPGGTDKLYQNVEERYDSSLEAVDRDVMQRSMRIYDEMNLENNPTN